MKNILYNTVFTISLITLFVGFYGCQSEDSLDIEHYRSYIELTVINEDSVPQADIQIEAGININGEIFPMMAKMTDNNGKAYFGNLIPGEYAFYHKPTVPGIFPDTIFEIVEYGKNFYWNFVVKMQQIAPATGKLVLTVLDTEKNSLNGFVMMFYDSKNVLIGEFKSDAFGRIKRFNMEPGIYRIIPKSGGNPMEILMLTGNNEFEYVM